MIRSFFTGVWTATRNWKMILLLLAANILFSIPIVVPIFLLIVQTSAGTLAADRMFADKIDVRWMTDVFNHQMAGFSLEAVGIQVVALLVLMGLGYLLLSTLLSGGIIEVFASEDGRFTMRKFWAGCGAYFWRFFRLTLISLIFYGAAVLIYILVRRPIDKMAEQATAYESVVFKRWAVMIVLVLMFAFVNMVFDYAKISVVINDSRRMFRETFIALRFSLRHFFITFGLYLLIAIVGMALFALPAWLRSSINQSSAIAVLLAILLGQIAIAARMWTRLTFYAAELDLYQRLKPKTAPVVAPPPSAEIEFLAATTEPAEKTEIVSAEEVQAMSASSAAAAQSKGQVDGEGKENA